ncbi:hypothetical protein GJU39_22355 [Pedobacter petrophilus]|uniref:Uncharacterized protein n=1 Tax=Pedobacter petrophilus TaxID=1908241 RepID=A0A7K0G5B5_9SPHI|nr:hypothetical protein [Pedobacter petrophilus]MRX78822.1 hypothetical protein [Pedobacter petrophilus]
MEIKLEIPEYTGEGIIYEWEYGFEIKPIITNGEILITANRAGLISLARQLLTLAQEDIPVNFHLHYDSDNSLEEGSNELIIQKI